MQRIYSASNNNQSLSIRDMDASQLDRFERAKFDVGLTPDVRIDPEDIVFNPQYDVLALRTDGIWRTMSNSGFGAIPSSFSLGKTGRLLDVWCGAGDNGRPVYHTALDAGGLYSMDHHSGERHFLKAEDDNGSDANFRVDLAACFRGFYSPLYVELDRDGFAQRATFHLDWGPPAIMSPPIIIAEWMAVAESLRF